MHGRVALVTGAASNTGRATALAIAAAGGSVVATDIDAPGLEATAAQVRADAGDTAVVVQTADLTRPEAAADLVDTAIDAYGGLDLVVHAAVDHGRGRIEAQTPEQWQRAMAVNVGAAAWIVGAALAHLEGRRGAVVLFSSIQAQAGMPATSLYGATKAAIEGLTRHLAVDLGPRCIRVNAISPGYVPPQPKPAGDPAYPMKRYGTADEIAGAVIFLASDAASWITGSILPVDGGISAAHPAMTEGPTVTAAARWRQRVRRFAGRSRP